MDRGSIEPGTEVYTSEGRLCTYRAATEHGHIVEPLVRYHEYDSGEFIEPSGKLIEVPRVFTSEPEDVYGAYRQERLKKLEAGE